MSRKLTLLILPAAIFLSCAENKPPPYKNAELPVEVRVNDLLPRMTIEEKFWQLFMIPEDLDKIELDKFGNGIFGIQVRGRADSAENALTLARKINRVQRYFVENTRLGIPAVIFEEALHGVVRPGATMFPQAIGLAATWDTVLMRDVAAAIAKETKARGIRDVLSPVINIASDVRWGRTEETYGEDPFLSSAMAVAFVSEFERIGIITTPKHFVANVGAGGRDSYPIHFNERLLKEIYLPPFKAAIKSGGSHSIMTAYNSLDGQSAGSNSWLLKTILKDQWKFGGFVITDANALGGDVVLHYTAENSANAGARAISNGMDVIFQTSYDHHRLFIRPFLENQIDVSRINDAVLRVLRSKMEIGLFDRPYVSEQEAETWISNTSHKELARKAARESIVLLKNANQILPLSKEIKSLAIIGLDAAEARLGGYSGPGKGKVNILEGIGNLVSSETQIVYHEGPGRKSSEWEVIPEEFLITEIEGETREGLKGEYYNNVTLEGEPDLIRLDPEVNFRWTLNSPARNINLDYYSVRWTGKITAPENGIFKIGLSGNDGYQLFLDNKRVIDRHEKISFHTSMKEFRFEQGKSYDIRIEFFEPVGNAGIKLIWNVGVNNDWKKKIADAVSAVEKSDVTVMVAGIIEGEFQDRAMLSLPGHQEELIDAICATGKPVIVILTGGSAITMNSWIDKVNAVLDVWYPGEEGGNAVADILFGDYNPAGRLPITFPLHEAQLPLVYNHKPTGRGDDYNNLSGLPLFPFGYGLSYSEFQYSNLVLGKDSISSSDSVIVRFDLRNSGSYAGDEVVQLYIRDLLASVSRPVMELKGFRRIHLRPGEEQPVEFTITPEMLTMLDKDLQEVIEPGEFRIMIGASSRDLRLKGTLIFK